MQTCAAAYPVTCLLPHRPVVHDRHPAVLAKPPGNTRHNSIRMVVPRSYAAASNDGGLPVSVMCSEETGKLSLAGAPIRNTSFQLSATAGTKAFCFFSRIRRPCLVSLDRCSPDPCYRGRIAVHGCPACAPHPRLLILAGLTAASLPPSVSAQDTAGEQVKLTARGATRDAPGPASSGRNVLAAPPTPTCTSSARSPAPPPPPTARSKRPRRSPASTAWSRRSRAATRARSPRPSRAAAG